MYYESNNNLQYIITNRRLAVCPRDRPSGPARGGGGRAMGHRDQPAAQGARHLARREAPLQQTGVRCAATPRRLQRSSLSLDGRLLLPRAPRFSAGGHTQRCPCRASRCQGGRASTRTRCFPSEHAGRHRREAAACAAAGRICRGKAQPYPAVSNRNSQKSVPQHT